MAVQGGAPAARRISYILLTPGGLPWGSVNVVYADEQLRRVFYNYKFTLPTAQQKTPRALRSPDPLVFSDSRSPPIGLFGLALRSANISFIA